MVPPTAVAPVALIAGAAVGAVAAYAFDPSLGRQRRHVLKDRAAHAVRKARHFSDVAVRDIRNRAEGAQVRIEESVHKGAHVGDRILVERVRAKLGRYVSHPGAIAVAAIAGNVDLSGQVLQEEHATVLKAVAEVRGVKALEDRLVVHRSAHGVPSLQGGKRPAGERGLLDKRNWAPAMRVVTASLAMGLLSYAAFGRGRLRVRAGIVGALLLARTVTNRPLAELADRPVDGREVPLAPPPEPGAWVIEER